VELRRIVSRGLIVLLPGAGCTWVAIADGLDQV